MEELKPEQRAATVKAMLEAYRVQLYQARVDRAANTGNAEGIAEVDKRITQLRRGIAAVESEFATDLAYVAKEEEEPNATG